MNSRKVLSLVTTLSIIFNFLTPIRIFADNAITGGSDTTGGISVNVAISDWQITGSGTIPVHLYVPSGTLSMTTTTGLTFTGASSGSNLYFSGSLEDINNALTTLQYLNGSAGTYTIELSLVAAGQIIYPATGHVYEVINNGSSITATAARAAALARSYNNEGIVWGYLANITSSEEDAFVGARLTQDGWFGASDEGSEGTWQWRDGPEAGTTFWTGLFDGVASGYENWSRYNDTGEPNDSGNEDCSEYYSDGSGWNDLPCDIPGSITTYVVEYGDTIGGGGPSSASDSLDVTISADTVTQTPTLTSPTSTSTQNTLQLTYSLPEVPTAGSVTITFNDGTTTTTLTMGNSQSVDTTVNLANLISTTGVTATTAASLADGTYTVTLSYQDYLGNPASTDVETAVVIDTTVLPVSVARPSDNETIQTTTSTSEGTCETGATISISNVHLQTNPTTVVCSGGVFSTSITFLSSGLNTPIALSFTQTDVAGNVSSATVKNVAYALQTSSGGGGGGQPKDEEKKTPVVTTIPEQTVTLPPVNSAEIQEEAIQGTPLNTVQEKTSCKINEFLTRAVKLGRKNNPEDVKLLEQFLNRYENVNLPVDGYYSPEDFRAVVKWQEKHANDILTPWGLKKGTGYIYKTSLAKIKEIEEGICK